MADEIARIEERLQTPVNVTGVGEDPALRQLLSKGEGEAFTKDDVEALEALYKTMSGGELPEALRNRFAATRALFDRRAENEKKHAEDPAKFMGELQQRSSSLMVDPAKKAELMAKTMKELQMARAEVHIEDMQIKANLDAEEQKEIIWPANPEILTTRVGDAMQSVSVPMKVRIGNLVYRYPIGMLVKVPLSVVRMLEQRQHSYEELQARKRLLDASAGKIKEDKVVWPEWNRINREFGSSTGAIPTS